MCLTKIIKPMRLDTLKQKNPTIYNNVGGHEDFRKAQNQLLPQLSEASYRELKKSIEECNCVIKYKL